MGFGGCCCRAFAFGGSDDHREFREFRSYFCGKVSPVHFFWGSFDLTVTRFSGRSEPPHPGGVPNLPDAVVQEAYCQAIAPMGQDLMVNMIAG